MSDDAALDLRTAIERKKARLAQQRAAIDSEEAELAELERLAALAAKHNFVLAPAPPSHANHVIATVDDLAECYVTHPNSSFHKLAFNARRTYIGHVKIIRREMGHMLVAELTPDAFKAVYAGWLERWSISTAHTLIAKLRVLFSFAVEVLNDDACAKARQILSTLRFETAVSTSDPMTEAHARAICKKAHEMGFPSIALAQAFQFDTRLKQADVIGMWTPLNEVGTSEIIDEKHGKWLRGIRWEKLDSNKLRHSTDTREGEIEIDLSNASLVLEELAKFKKLPTSGPMIVWEATGKPWTAIAFRQHWRKVADKAGVPRTVKNKDSGLTPHQRDAATSRPLRNTAGA